MSSLEVAKPYSTHYEQSVSRDKKDAPFSIYFTSDTHSALEEAADPTFINLAAAHPKIQKQIEAKKLDKNSEIGGVARRIEYLEAVKKLNPRSTLVLDAGDFLEGTLWYHTYKGDLDIDLMNDVKYDAVAIGNHDFAAGWEQLKTLIQKAQFSVLSANLFEIDPVTQKPKTTPIAEPYKIFDVAGGHKVAVIGVMGKDAWMGISPKLRPSLSFEAPEKILPPLLEKLRPDVDYIVLLSHSGLGTDRELAEKFPQIDAVLGGHSHTLMQEAEQVGKTPVFHPYARGRMVAKLEVNPRQTTSSVEILDATWDPKVSATAKKVQSFIASKKAEVEGAYQKQIAKCVEPVSGRGKVHQNTDLGKLLAEMLRTSGDIPADAAFVLTGSFKGEGLEGGPITLKTLHELLPHDGEVWTVRVNGVWLEKMMADNEKRWGKQRQFQYSGIEWTPEGLKLQGQPLVKDQEYTVRAAAFFFEREILDEKLKLRPELQTEDPALPSVKGIEVFPDPITDLYTKAFTERGTIAPLTAPI